MPISLRELQNRGVDLEVEFFDMVGTVTYDPTRITQIFRQEWQKRVEERQQARIAAALKPLAAKVKKGTELTPEEQQKYDDLSAGREAVHTDDRQRRVDAATGMCELVKGWDTIGIDGAPMPLDPEVIADQLPERFINEVTFQVFLDVNTLGRARDRKTPAAA